MTSKAQLQLFEDFTSYMKFLLESKAKDYANEDVLIAFKRTGYLTGKGPAGAALQLIATKVARLAELLEGKHPQHESVRDTIIDLANYTFLLNCIVYENDIDKDYD